MEKIKTQKPPLGKWFLGAGVVIIIFFLAIVLIWQSTAMQDVLTSQKQLEQKVTQMEKQTTLEQLEDETANWQVYQDLEYDFKLKHPKNWKVDPERIQLRGVEQGNGFLILSLTDQKSDAAYGAEGDLFVNVYVYPTTKSLKNWFEEYEEFDNDKVQETIDFMKEYAYPEHHLKKSDIIISIDKKAQLAGQEAIIQNIKFLKPGYIEGPASTSKAYYLKKDNLIYDFVAGTPTGAEAQDLIDLFDKVMLTFSFIE